VAPTTLTPTPTSAPTIVPRIVTLTCSLTISRRPSSRGKIDLVRVARGDSRVASRLDIVVGRRLNIVDIRSYVNGLGPSAPNRFASLL